jgi:hypothetical protein
MLEPNTEQVLDMEDLLRHLAQKIEWIVWNNLGDQKGFTLLLFDFSTPTGNANYISNALRSDMIKVLRKTADHLEEQLDMPPVTKTIK